MPQSLLKSWKHRLVCIQRCSAYALGWRQLSVSAAAASAPECLSHFIRIIWRRSTREDVWMAKQVNAAADNTIAADTKLTEPRWHLWSVLDGNALCELSVQTSCLRCFYHLMLLQTAVLLQLCPSYYREKVSYRKQIACQHSCCQTFWPRQGHGQPYNNFPHSDHGFFILLC